MAAKQKTDPSGSDAAAEGDDGSAPPPGTHPAPGGLPTARGRPLLLAGASVRSLAKSVCRLRLRPWCRDSFGDADLHRLLEFHGGRYCGRLPSFAALPELCRGANPEIPILCGGGIENQLDVLEQLRCERPVLNMPPAAMRRARDAEALAAAMTQRDVRCPATHAARTFKRPAGSERWVYKPRNGGGGQGIRFLGPNESAVAADGVCQQFLDGLPFSALFLGRPGSGVELIGASLQCIGWPELGGAGFQYCGAVGPLRLPDRLRSELLRIGTAVADECRVPPPNAADFVGLFGLDLLLRGGRLWLIEVNPRITASHELHESPGRSPLQLHLACFPEIARKLRPEPLPALRKCGQAAARCLLVVWNSHRTVLPPDAVCPIVPTCGIPLSPDPDRAVWAVDVPQPGLPVARGHPLCSLRATAASFHELPSAIGNLATSRRLPRWIARSLTPQRIAVRLADTLRQFDQECELT